MILNLKLDVCKLLVLIMINNKIIYKVILSQPKFFFVNKQYILWSFSFLIQIFTKIKKKIIQLNNYALILHNSLMLNDNDNICIN